MKTLFKIKKYKRIPRTIVMQKPKIQSLKKKYKRDKSWKNDITL